MSRTAIILLGIVFFCCDSSINPESMKLAEKSQELTENGQFEESFRLSSKAIEIDKRNFIAFNNRGCSRKELKNDSNLIVNDFLEAIRLNPNYLIAKWNIIVFFFDFQDWKNTIKFGEQYLIKQEAGYISRLVGISYNNIDQPRKA